MEQLGFWEFLHGTSAGCASIAAWESMRSFASHGPLLLIAYACVGFGLFHLQQKHLRKVRARRAKCREAAAHSWEPVEVNLDD